MLILIGAVLTVYAVNSGLSEHTGDGRFAHGYAPGRPITVIRRRI